MKNVIQFNNPNSASSVDDIDLKEVLKCLYRRKLLIVLTTLASFGISALYAFTRKPIWEGQFQIVVENEGSANSSISNSFAGSSLLNIGRASKLETEVKILESPSILKPTYDFVKALKIKNGEDLNNWSFYDWRNSNLAIKLEKGTSVLSITYRDSDKDLILPVIKRISSDYQKYSGRDRLESIRNGLQFAQEKVAQFRQISEESSRNLDSFSIKYGISSDGGLVSSSNLKTAKPLGTELGLGSFLQNSPSQSSEIRQGDSLGQLASINQDLIRRQQQFTKNDPTIISLVRERDALRRYNELTANGTLTLPDPNQKSKENAQQVILQFKELKRKAEQDLNALNTLEGSLLSLQLEQARNSNPWELITTPTLLDIPVAPRKSRIIAFGMFVGIVLGCGIALICDRRSGLVFSVNELQSLIPCPLLQHLPAHKPETWSDAVELLASSLIANASHNSPIALIPIGGVSEEQLHRFSTELQRAMTGYELFINPKLHEAIKCSNQLLVTAPGIATRTELSQASQNFALQGVPLIGWVLLDPELNLG